MIDSIKGILINKSVTSIAVEIGGIRLKVNISGASTDRLPQIGDEVEILTYLHVREDILDLYGFFEESERDIFIKLINVSGIGPRSAVSILSGATIQEFKNRIIAEDVDSLTIIPGIGPKTAKRIILELKEKISNDEVESANLVGIDSSNIEIKEAVLALQSLGYKRRQINEVLQKIMKTGQENLSTEKIIKKVLTVINR